MTSNDDAALRLIQVAEELDQLSDDLDDSTTSRKVVGTICGQQSSLILDLAHELETDAREVTHGAP